MRHLRNPKLNPLPAPRGRPFPNGNSGRKPGPKKSYNGCRSGFAYGDAEALTRKAVEFAKAGDVAMLKFLLGRILRLAQNKAMSRKASDEFTIPLCRGHHREVHHCGDEAAWWAKAGVDPIIAARPLARKSPAAGSAGKNNGPRPQSTRGAIA